MKQIIDYEDAKSHFERIRCLFFSKFPIIKNRHSQPNSFCIWLLWMNCCINSLDSLICLLMHSITISFNIPSFSLAIMTFHSNNTNKQKCTKKAIEKNNSIARHIGQWENLWSSNYDTNIYPYRCFRLTHTFWMLYKSFIHNSQWKSWLHLWWDIRTS